MQLHENDTKKIQKTQNFSTYYKFPHAKNIFP